MADLARIGLLAAVYVLFAKLGLAIHSVSSFATLVWPCSGIALAAVLVFGYRIWPGIAIGAIVANLWIGAPPLVALAIGAGNSLEAVLAAYALKRIPGFRGSFDRLQDTVGLVLLAGAGATAVCATIGVSGLELGGLITPDRFALTWRAWWLGDAIGILVVTPLLLTLRPIKNEIPRRLRLVELSVLVALLALGSYILFERSPQGMPTLIWPLLIWSAIRFDQRGAARAMFLVSVVAVWGTVRGHGPFAGTTVEESLFHLQAFMAVSAATFLVLGAVISERRRAEEERRRAEAVVRESEERHRTLTEAVDQMLWINDAGGRTLYMNPKVEELVGPLDLSRDPPGAIVIHPEDREAALAVRRQALEAGLPYVAEYRIRVKNGQYRWMIARVVPVKDLSGRVLSWIGAAADVDDLKTAETRLRQAKEEAEAANRAKDQFLAALSHELRTPLTPILAIASVMEKDPDLPDYMRKQVESVRRNAELEARLIDDLLDLTRIAKGKLKIERQPVEISEALEDVIGICRAEIAAKGLRLESNGAGSGTFVEADPARIRQVFWNVLKNAVKFTPRGGRISLRAIQLAPGRIAVEVADSGVGIEPSELSRIFQPFQQAGERGGLGLGLAISSTFVQAHGGTLTASSEGRGHGATFRIELPTLAQTEQPPREAGSAPGVSNPCEGRRLLLVEDHADTLSAARDLLSELGCEVVAARSVEEALAAARAQPFDLVVSDLGLPDGSGLDLMRELHRHYGLAGIALTGYGMEEDQRLSREAGFVEHLVKPITLERLEAAIDRFFVSSP